MPREIRCGWFRYNHERSPRGYALLSLSPHLYPRKHAALPQLTPTLGMCATAHAGQCSLHACILSEPQIKATNPQRMIPKCLVKNNGSRACFPVIILSLFVGCVFGLVPPAESVLFGLQNEKSVVRAFITAQEASFGITWACLVTFSLHL